jgi:putative ABC transport system permease protein
VVQQFTMAIIFINSTQIITKQISYMKDKDLGFDKRDAVIIPIYTDGIHKSLRTIKTELKNNINVTEVAAASEIPSWSVPKIEVDIIDDNAGKQETIMDVINVDDDYIRAMGITMAAGRNFLNGLETGQRDEVIINETAVKQFGWNDPIGKTIQTSENKNNSKLWTVAGVVKDFHYTSLYRKIEPLLIKNNADNFNYVIVRINPADKNKTLEFIKHKWNEFDPKRPFDYFFLDEHYDRPHKTVERIRDVFSYFSIFALIIACLGIFGLSTFSVQNRMKEVGIRKVLGATTRSVFLKLNYEILRLVLISVVIAFTIIKASSFDLSQFFPYMTELNLLPFVYASLLVFIVAFTTISFQLIKISRSNPVEVLRYE